MVVPTMLVGIHIAKFIVCKGYESKDLGFRMLSKEFTIKPMPYAKSILICQGRLLLILCVNYSFPTPARDTVLNAFILLFFQLQRLIPFFDYFL